jgi:tol-pal system protein YbgF
MTDLSRSVQTAAALAAAWFLLVAPAGAQMSASDLVVRIDQLENQVRQLTGTIEQLQFRNRQLEEQLRRVQEADVRSPAGSRPVAPPPGGAIAQPPAPLPAPLAAEPTAPPQPAMPAGAAPGRRADVFDPSQNPNAPGAPRTLGSIASAAPEPPATAPAGPYGARVPGAPLDLSAPAGQGGDTYAAVPPAAAPPAAAALPPPTGAGLPPPTGAGLPPPTGAGLPPPPPRNPNATGGTLATLPPSATPRDEFDLAYGYVLHKDYALADQGFRSFLKKYPGDPRAADANYWLGESLFQRQKYRDAAELFLLVTRDHGTAAKAPDALLRLGQSLAQLGEKDAACGTLAEVGRKYPRAALSVKQAVEREQKRVHC